MTDTNRAEPMKPEEKIAPVQGWVQGIPWSIHLEAYAAYSKKWAPQEALIDLEGRNCRGGFSVDELDEFVPGWRDRVSEIGRLLTENARLRAEVEASRLPLAGAATSDAAVPQNIRERWNIELDGRDLLVCFNDHEKGKKCRYERYVPATSPLPTAPAGARPVGKFICKSGQWHQVMEANPTGEFLYRAAAAPLERIARRLTDGEILEALVPTGLFKQEKVTLTYESVPYSIDKLTQIGQSITTAIQHKFAEVNGITLALGEAKGS